MTALARLWRHHRGALLLFAAAVALTLFFAARFVAFGIYWADPAHRDRSPEGWMTPGYLARSWDLPREALRDLLALPETEGKPPTLAEIARTRGEPLDAFLAGLRDDLDRLKADPASGRP